MTAPSKGASLLNLKHWPASQVKGRLCRLIDANHIQIIVNNPLSLLLFSVYKRGQRASLLGSRKTWR